MAPLSTAERLALERGVGLGAIGLGALLLGLIGLFRGIVFGPLLLILAMWLRRSLLGWLRDAIRLVGRIMPAKGARWTGFLAGFVLVLLAAALILALAPPTAWDALTYHLVAPEVYLRAGRSPPTRKITSWASPNWWKCCSASSWA